ncbi:MAG: hypothetical protein IIC55_01950 [Proteobacteria bacterium]|nr:hypothetical protein [Pseudomonadota bacterium]
MKRLQDQHHFNWLAPNDLFERFLDKVSLADGTSVREELQQIEDGKAFADQVLAMTEQTAEDVLLYKQRRDEWDAARDLLMERMEENFLHGGSEGRWIAFGRKSPFSDEELVPPHFWDFLKLDRGSRKATNEQHGIEFSGLRCLILQDLSREWRLIAVAEMDALDAATNKVESNQPNGLQNKAKRGRKSKKLEMINAFDELNRLGELTDSDLANKKGVWGKVLQHLKIKEDQPGYSYSTFVKHVGPKIERELKIRNSEN